MKFSILHYLTLDSTNNTAKELAEGGAREGTVIFSDYQTKGRGRFKRKWVSSKGKDLLFSVILRPSKLKASHASMITQVTAMSIQKVLGRFGVSTKIKRPNDLLVDGKKICGILVESSTSSNMIDYVVVGVGLNINTPKKELFKGAASMYEVLGKQTERGNLLQGLLEDFGKRITELGWSS